MIGFTPDMLRRGRAVARSRMRATVRIRRRTGTTLNPVTGMQETTWDVVYPDGIAEVRMSDARPTDGDAVGQRLAEQQPLVVLPVDGPEAVAAAAVTFDDVGEVLADPDNPGNVGVTFRIAGEHVKSLTTARRLPVEVRSHA